MDSFEAIVASFLIEDGYWVIRGYKVELTKPEKRLIGKHSSPRWEIDLIAYKPQSGELLAVECKSYLDSNGVDPADVMGTGKHRGRYKLFTDDPLREVVFKRLVEQLREAGLILEGVAPKLSLAIGATFSDLSELKSYFDERSWRLFPPSWLHEKLQSMANRSYHDSETALTSKLILRSLNSFHKVNKGPQNRKRRRSKTKVSSSPESVEKEILPGEDGL